MKLFYVSGLRHHWFVAAESPEETADIIEQEDGPRRWEMPFQVFELKHPTKKGLIELIDSIEVSLPDDLCEFCGVKLESGRCHSCPVDKL